MQVISREYVKSLLPRRDRNMHKGDCGRVLITGGCTGMTGAVVLCAKSAIRMGSGLVTVAVPESLNIVFEIKLTEAMSLPLECDGGAICGGAGKALSFASKCDALAIGSGMGTADCAADFFEEFIKKSRAPVIIDADGLNILAKKPELFPYINNRAVLTPHLGEMSRLTGLTAEEINNSRKAVAEDFAKKYGVVVALKGMNTIVTDGEKTLVCDKGNPGMATGGSGDCLTGIILSLAGQGHGLFDACCGGVYLHALAGDIAAQNVGEYSLIASDIIKYLPQAVMGVM